MKNTIFGKRLAGLLAEQNISPNEFSVIMGTSLSTVYNWLNGLTPSINKIDKIAKTLHTTRIYLLSTNDELKNQKRKD
ncbi:MAG: helix-turn-helix domain-containing protein [Hominimerdicola sp.]